MSQDFHQPAFEFLQHAHGNTGHQNMNWHGFCSGTAFYEWSRWNTYRRRTVNPSQAGWHFDIVLWDTHRAGATLMTPAWCYETLPPIGSPVWCASHGEALFSQTRRKEHENRFKNSVQQVSGTDTPHLVASMVLLYYFVNCWLHFLLSISVARITSFHPIFLYSCTKT